MQNPNDPLLCNPETGVCELPGELDRLPTNKIALTAKKPVKIIYFTDPICSSCWGIEPQLRKLKLEYGDIIDIEYRMGGLLPDWSYNSGGISKPSDVAHHWDEVSKHYDMPIDGQIWLEDPLPSSYPPSIACKAALIQNYEKSILFLREIREMVFLEKKNITKWEHLEQAAQNVGLNIAKFKVDYHGKANELFEEDLRLAKALGVRGFPTLFFSNEAGNVERIYGSKPYETFEDALLKMIPKAKKNKYKKSWGALFEKYSTLTAKEFSVLADMKRNKCEEYLDELTKTFNLTKLSTKNGSIWKLPTDEHLN